MRPKQSTLDDRLRRSRFCVRPDEEVDSVNHDQSSLPHQVIEVTVRRVVALISPGSDVLDLASSQELRFL